MVWRTIVFTNRCKLELSQGYLVLFNEKGINKIYLDEIDSIILESTAISITTALICELSKRKINVLFCDEKHNPISQLNLLYGSHNSSLIIKKQISWDKNKKDQCFLSIIRLKLINQNKNLKTFNDKNNFNIENLISNLSLDNCLVSEAIAAKIYFKNLFGDNFHRHYDDLTNLQLNYGYSIILSLFNREISSFGNLTQLGINHKNQFNHFNLSSDLMEPFRFIVEWIVKYNKFGDFTSNEKKKIVEDLNFKDKIIYEKNRYDLTTFIRIYLSKIFKFLNNECETLENLDFDYEI